MKITYTKDVHPNDKEVVEDGINKLSKFLNVDELIYGHDSDNNIEYLELIKGDDRIRIEAWDEKAWFEFR